MSFQARGEKLGIVKCENGTICSKSLWNFNHRGCRHTNHGFAERPTNVTEVVLDAAGFWHSSSSCMMVSIQSRSLGGSPGKSNAYSPREQYIQQVVAVTSSSISMLSGLISFYWFATMHRNFRHQYVTGIAPLQAKKIKFSVVNHA